MKPLSASLAVLWLALSFLVNAPALAQHKFANTERRASYGPLAACIGGYAIDVREGEAVSAFVNADNEIIILTLLNLLTERAEYLGASTGLPDGIAASLPSSQSAVTLPGNIAAKRVDYENWKGYRAGIPGEAVWDSIPAHHSYILPELESQPAVTLTANVFKKSNDDSKLLGRVVPRSSVTCGVLGKSPAAGLAPEAAVWRPKVVEGPLKVCGGSLAINVPTGYTLRKSWPNLNGASSQFILQDESQAYLFYDISFEGKRRPPSGSFRDLGFKLDQHHPGYAYFKAPYSSSKSRKWDSFYVEYTNASSEQLENLLGLISYEKSSKSGCDMKWD